MLEPGLLSGGPVHATATWEIDRANLPAIAETLGIERRNPAESPIAA
ncbi:MAG: hypothetical protein JO212_12890 [Acetobacteraceae bacterium]|nr:hypothetical protein [Acetobacteraceae bacterium]